jgi:hypothetical protein
VGRHFVLQRVLDEIPGDALRQESLDGAGLQMRPLAVFLAPGDAELVTYHTHPPSSPGLLALLVPLAEVLAAPVIRSIPDQVTR